LYPRCVRSLQGTCIRVQLPLLVAACSLNPTHPRVRLLLLRILAAAVASNRTASSSAFRLSSSPHVRVHRALLVKPETVSPQCVLFCQRKFSEVFWKNLSFLIGRESSALSASHVWRGKTRRLIRVLPHSFALAGSDPPRPAHRHRKTMAALASSASAACFASALPGRRAARRGALTVRAGSGGAPPAPHDEKDEPFDARGFRRELSQTDQYNRKFIKDPESAKAMEDAGIGMVSRGAFIARATPGAPSPVPRRHSQNRGAEKEPDNFTSKIVVKFWGDGTRGHGPPAVELETETRCVSTGSSSPLHRERYFSRIMPCVMAPDVSPLYPLRGARPKRRAALGNPFPSNLEIFKSDAPLSSS